MMNVAVGEDRFAIKSSCDFEEIDSWSRQSSGMSASMESSVTPHLDATNKKDDSILTIFTQSIEIFGSAVSPWPCPANSKTLPEQVAGIFITSEAPKEDAVQFCLEANKPQIQSKLRRSSSNNRRLSVSRINEETIFDSQRIYNELEPIPIVSSVERSKSINLLKSVFRSSSSASSSSETGTNENEITRKTSRLQNWLNYLYASSSSSSRYYQQQNNKNYDVECAMDRYDAVPLKGILKKGLTVSSNSNSPVPSPPNTNSPSPQLSNTTKKSFKLRFDNEVSVCETFHKEDYSRQSLDYVARQLTPTLALSIKKELNSIKQEMEIHDDSRHLTQFYLIK